MAAYYTRGDYDCDLAYTSTAERGLTLHDLAREPAVHRGRHQNTEAEMAISRDLSIGVVRHGTVHHTYECRGRDMCYVSSRRETDSMSIADAVRRNHRRVDDQNRKIRPGSDYSQVRAVHWETVHQTDWQQNLKVHPKLKSDGTYPIDFPFALRVEQFEAMDMRILDRILISYGLLCTFTGQNRDIKRRKLWRLFEFLGADRLTPSRDQNCAHGAYGGGGGGGAHRYIAW